MQAMNFAFKDYFKTLFPKSKNDSNIKKLFQNTVSGGLAGVVAVTGTCLSNF